MRTKQHVFYAAPFGTLIRTLRILGMGATLEQMAETTTVPLKRLAKIEAGKAEAMSFAEARVIFTFLDVSQRRFFRMAKIIQQKYKEAHELP